ncbi:FadR/GntR family transcriptional regulator [Sulfitobacter sp. JB4-11]|uniref:FadR/GntR family transcriptional regulator n=1 Tax=Sulfitobacter rhodophyticola TaxID=3238304 RepID=UPI0035132D73
MEFAEPFSFDADQKIRKEGAAEKVVHRILDLVKSGNLKAGDKLPAERKMIEIFGLSRPTLREALRSLSILGVIEMRHGGGAFVTDLDARSLLGPLDFFVSLSAENAQEVFACRRIVEVEVAKLCVEKATEANIEELDAMVAAQEKIASDPIAFRILDLEFHEKLFEIAGNSVMERLALGFYNMGLEARRAATAKPSVTKRSVKEHQAIVAGIRARSTEETSRAIGAHLDHIEATTLDAMTKAQK